MRGKRRIRSRDILLFRIIPAHAGQTSSWQYSRSHIPDHPRACGANLAVILGVHFESGSSPRMRGKHAITANSLNQSRIIPAHAGQTGSRHLNDNGHTDHPRACGANQSGRPACIGVCGSSPRMRGKRCVGHVQHPWPRIIPAHAGQTH